METMSLPTDQQRTLDQMSEALRASDPRLASMFAMFTRLTGNEAAPRSEQLPAEQRLPFRLLRRPFRRRAARSAGRGGRPANERRRLSLRPARHPSPRRALRGDAGRVPSRSRLFLRQVLIASPLAVALVIVGLVVAFNHAAPPGCTGDGHRHVAARHHEDAGKCPGPAGSVSGQLVAR